MVNLSLLRPSSLLGGNHCGLFVSWVKLALRPVGGRLSLCRAVTRTGSDCALDESSSRVSEAWKFVTVSHSLPAEILFSSCCRLLDPKSCKGRCCLLTNWLLFASHPPFFSSWGWKFRFPGAPLVWSMKVRPYSPSFLVRGGGTTTTHEWWSIVFVLMAQLL